MEAEPPASSSSVLVPLHCSNEPTFPGDGLEPGHCIPGLGSDCTPQRRALTHFEVLWCWITVNWDVDSLHPLDHHSCFLSAWGWGWEVFGRV